MPSYNKMMQYNGKPMRHLGEMVQAELDRRHVTTAEMARRLGIAGTTLLRTLRQPTLHAALLWNIGQALNVNLFAQLAIEFPIPPPPSSQEEELRQQLATLQQQLADAQKENQLYQKVLDAVGRK